MLKKFLVVASLLLISASTVHASFFDTIAKEVQNLFPTPTAASTVSASSAPEAVLGSGSYNTEAPSIYINGSNSAYSSGGLITQAVTDDPGIFISGYKLPAELQIKIYRASENDLFNYLVHDKDYKQLHPHIDTSSMTVQGTATISLTSDANGNYQSTYHALPFSGMGMWYLEIAGENVQTTAFILRSGHGVFTSEEDNTLLFWGERFDNMRSIGAGGTLKTYSVLDTPKELSSVSYDDAGTARTPLTDQADFAISQLGDDIALVPLNLTYLNSGYNYDQFRPRALSDHYFTFVDRPVYQPGDKLYFKSVIRTDNDAQYSIPTGVAYATLFENNNKLQELTIPISADGTIDGTISLPADIKTGWYTLQVQTSADRVQSSGSQGYPSYGEYTGVSNYSSAYFQVQYYRKPEASLDIESNRNDLIAGSPLTVTLDGSYYSGAPLMSQGITYTVRAADYYEYAYLSDYEQYKSNMSDDYQYGGWYGTHDIKKGTVYLDKNGKAQIDIPTTLNYDNQGKPQVFIVEATLEDGSQDPLFARKNILVRPGQFGIFATDYTWSAQVNKEVRLPVVTVPYETGTKITATSLQAKLTLHQWNKIVDSNEKYPRYEEKVTDLGGAQFSTDNFGHGTYTFTPQAEGSYQILISGTDALGNKVSKEFYVYASSSSYSVYIPGMSEESLSVATDRKKYTPGESANITITSSIPDRDVLLSVERGYERRFQIVKMSGTTGTVSLPIITSDQPNIYLAAYGFSKYRLDRAQTALSIDTADKKMVVSLVPDKTVYGPGETMKLDITTTDANGHPLSANVAVWAVDKAIFALTDSRLGDIFKTFWGDRVDSTSTSHSLRGILVQTAERGGGCFVGDTAVTLANGSTALIKDIKVGQEIRTLTDLGTTVNARVSAVTHTEDDGYMVINGVLRVTPDHLINVNGTWREAGQAQIGDYLSTISGSEIISSLSYEGQKTEVYNLTVDREHTFLADGIWVHNEKGMDRTIFKDVAYWNPNVRTGSDGKATITAKLPDNLTTWTIAGVGNTTATAVGQSTVDIQVNKDLVVKPIVPNLVRVGDKLTLSAIARNFTEVSGLYNIGLQLTGGTIDGPAASQITLAGKSSEQGYWSVTPDAAAKELKYTMGVELADNKNVRDTVTGVIPVEPFGFSEKDAQFQIGDASYTLTLPADAKNTSSQVTLYLAPSLVTSLQSSMHYLLQYPYGCVEQLTSRLVPALLAKGNAALFADAAAGINLDTYIKDGISKINEAHDIWTGWGWWSHGNVTPFVTSYVLEAYQDAQKLGYGADVSDPITTGLNYLEHQTNGQSMGNEERITRRYGLSLFKKTTAIPGPDGNLADLDPDLIAMHVITSVNYGDKSGVENGVNALLATAQTEGNTVYWKAGNSSRLGSIGASTAWAVRALTAAGADQGTAAKGLQYLLKNHHTDYWYNSYATVLTARAILAVYTANGESAPDYTYTVKLGNKVVKTARVTSATQALKPITLSIHDLAAGENTVTVTRTGTGQLYSTLSSDLFRTDPHAGAVSHGLSLKRAYINDRNPDRTIALGDIARVEFTVSGLGAGSQYLVIEDQLPAGLVPINDTFTNEQFSTDNGAPSDYRVSKEFTKNGANLVVYQTQIGGGVYSYKARVVSMGDFQAPPAVASLMYSPEVNGRTVVSNVHIDSESKLLPGRVAQSIAKGVSQWLYYGIGVLVVVVGIVGYFVYRHRRKVKQNVEDNPQTPPDGTPTTV